MVKVLVTGGAGFIGSNFVHHALSTHDDWEVTTLDKLTYAGRLENLQDVIDHPRHVFVKGDVADASVAAPLVQASEIVVHFAAETHVDRSILNAGEFITTDVFGTFVLLEAARQAPALRRFVQISTDEVYGSVPEGSSREGDELRPRNPYSASKAGADRLAYSYWATYGVPVIITRASNNYGPKQFPEKVIPLFITNALDDVPVPLYGDGLNERDWLHVLDHCRALDLLIGSATNGEVYNVGGGHPIPNAVLTKRILELLDKPQTLIRHVTDRPGHDRRYSLDTTKLESLGWTPQVTFEEGLAGTVEWYQRQRMVVAARQTRRRGVQEVLPGPVRHADLNQSTHVISQIVTVPLVTGAAGFAGSHLLEHLLETEPSVAAWSNPAGRPPGQTDRRVLWRAVDLLDAGRRRVTRSPSCARPRSITAPGLRTSADRGRRPNGHSASTCWAPIICWMACGTQASTARCSSTGSALVYRPSAGPISEDSPIGPTSPYGVSKLAQEMLALQAAPAPTIVARPFNHAGPRQTTDYVTSAFARQIAEIERGLAPPVLRVGNLESRRDITDVRDVVRAYRLLLSSGQPQRPYNVCSGTAYRVGDLLEGLVATGAAARSRSKSDPARCGPRDNPVVLGDRSRILDEVGWAPEIPIERTLADLLDYWRQRVGSAPRS